MASYSRRPRNFCRESRRLGYNAVSLDDVAHLSDHAWFEPEVRARNAVFREEFRALFAILRANHLRIYLTADFVTASPAVIDRLKDSADATTAWFSEVAAACLDDFPEVEGIILRIGEADGQDVEDLLRSRLVLRTAKEVNRMLHALLPVFERRERRLIFRTWTVGAFLIGDLIWHRGRLASALRGIQSRVFVLSMKYGESDFFRYLPLNRHFFEIELPKIIELQARREYEGAGEYPSFIGWDCEHYARELAGARNVIGYFRLVPDRRLARFSPSGLPRSRSHMDRSECHRGAPHLQGRGQCRAGRRLLLRVRQIFRRH